MRPSSLVPLLGFLLQMAETSEVTNATTSSVNATTPIGSSAATTRPGTSSISVPSITTATKSSSFTTSAAPTTLQMTSKTTLAPTTTDVSILTFSKSTEAPTETKPSATPASIVTSPHTETWSTATTPAPTATAKEASSTLPSPGTTHTRANTPEITAGGSTISAKVETHKTSQTPDTGTLSTAPTEQPTTTPQPSVSVTTKDTIEICFNHEGIEVEGVLVTQLCKILKTMNQTAVCYLPSNTAGSSSRVLTHGEVDRGVVKKLYNELNDVSGSQSPYNTTLIAILLPCVALLLIIIGFALYAYCHGRSYKKNQQLTEELQTVENGYHDNPTLEVMEGLQEEKKVFNEFNDSWIVPYDSLPDEEDTHL
ncbi:podocalyxin isoform X3 [Denticeps clupeoides]|uniref:podocalyxin isoform X3 n=1 Tax=Denticeps clupeoides TaxID=299321 RepID=UPI0010A49388|nr:podocalyxin isoform X3 [Denticeps clupeoides]